MANDTSVSFLSLPGEIRNTIYEQVLVSENPLDVLWIHKPKPKLTAALLRTRRQIYREASSMLYARNCFDFCKRHDVRGVLSFFYRIGRYNAQLIQHVTILFPEYWNLLPGRVTINTELFDVIRHYCPRLKTFTIPARSAWVLERNFSRSKASRDVKDEALGIINASFRDFPHLSDVIVERRAVDALESRLQQGILNQGWTIRVV